MDGYRLEPLTDSQSQIRILTLLPATGYEDAIKCELQAIDVQHEVEGDARGDYEAVSYTWGDALLAHHVLIEGKRLPITVKLDTALRHLRNRDRKRTLWIDGICIDQSNNREKNHQVQMLRRTFGNASQVLIWLGLGNDHTDYAIHRLNELARLRRQKDNLITDQYDVDQVEDEALHNGLRDIFARPWWSRLWTMIELLFSSSRGLLFICGGSSTTWLILDVSTSSGLPRRLANVWLLGDAERAGESPEEDWQLGAFLRYISDCEATDPRDHIFAMAGLLPENMRRMQLPDYALSVSVVYQRVTVALLRSDRGLYRNCIRGSRNLQIPSWCIDFSVPDWDKLFERYCVGEITWYEHVPAYGDMQPTHEVYQEDQGLLMFDGVKVDTISEVLRPPDINMIDLSEDLQHVSTLRALMKRWIGSILPFRGTVLRRLQVRLGKEQALRTFQSGDFWNILVGGWNTRDTCNSVRSRENGRTEAVEGFLENVEIEGLAFEDLERNFTNAMSAAKSFGTTSPSDCVFWLYYVDLAALPVLATDLEDRTLFVSEHGYLGRCQGQCREEDVVAILSRSIYPVVLRQNEDSTWEHVSPAYVQGIMAGEYVQDLDTLEQREFWLS